MLNTLDVNFLMGTASEFRTVANWLVDIYNDDRESKVDYMVINNPASLRAIYIVGIGGIIIDQLSNADDPDQKRTIAHYLCIEKRHRNKGRAKSFVNWAVHSGNTLNTPFVGAYVEGSDQIDLWESLGYPVQSNIGFSITMFNKPAKDIFNYE